MESAAQSIVSKLGQLVVDELKDIRGVGDKVVLLMDELSTMNAFLRMISEADQSTVDHLMREWEKQVRELAYDAEDCADIYHLRIRRPMALQQLPHIIVKWPKYQLKKLLLQCAPGGDAEDCTDDEDCTDTYCLRIHRPIPLLRHIVTWPKYQLKKLLLQRALAADVKALLARATAVSERRVRYGIDRAALPSSPWFAPLSGSGVSSNALRRANDPDDQLVGIKGQADTLAKRIKAKDDDGSLKVFSIVGFGGLGKTTLQAVELCRRLDADFQRQALVSVSQAFDGGKDMKGLLARLLKQVTKVKEGHEQPNNIEGAGTSTPTTQDNQPAVKLDKKSIACSVSDDLVHRMKSLELEDSKSLFVKRVFGSVGDTCPIELKDIMENILKKCGGMPLAIVSIASLLASYNSAENVDMWERISKSIGSQMETHPTLERMSLVITLSYDYLPHHLKACMMYLSIFPEDYVIAKDRLLYRWIAEGLVAEKRGLTLFEVTEEYFNELIARNMIQPDKLTTINEYQMTLEYETMEACRVHDMMLEVMVSKSQDANFVRLVGRQYGEGLSGGKIRRLSIHGNDDKDHISSHKKEMEQRHHARQGIETMNLQQVRSLTIFRAEGVERLLDRLGEFKLLRVLDLEDWKDLQNKHMRYVCRLYLLRYLGLAGKRITEMPREIGDLEYLETLDVKRTNIYKMPPTVTKLSKLERLNVPPWILPRGIGNMKTLRDVLVAREIGELQQLQVLRLHADVAGESGEEFSHALGSSLSKTCALRSLHLSTLSTMKTLDFLLHVSSPPPLLRQLTMKGPISRFPDWISSLKHLTEFSMECAKVACDQVLDSLCKLPSLQSIELGHHSFGEQELVARTTHRFPALRILRLNLAGYHPEVVKFEQGSMTKLETLLLEFGSMGKSIFGIDKLENLREVKLEGKEDLEDNPLERVLKQLEDINKERHERVLKQPEDMIKVVVEYYNW